MVGTGTTLANHLVAASLVLWPLLVGSVAAAAEHPKVASRLRQLVVEATAVQPDQLPRIAAAYGAKAQAPGRLLVEYRWQKPAPTRAALVATLADVGGTLAAFGADRADIWVPPRAVALLAEGVDATWLTLPVAPALQAGVVSEGVDAIGARPFHCQGFSGKGVQVAVVDTGFDLWAEAQQQQELPSNTTQPPKVGTSHGTACAEVIHDVAPEATLIPVSVGSVASLQAWAAQTLQGSDIGVIAHAMGWFGESFGDGKGVLCKLISELHGAGKVWVNAAGNMADGLLWLDAWRDDNGDGWLEFADGLDRNTFDVPAVGLVTVVLDWNSYPATTIDLDLHLCKVLNGQCQLVASSTNLQTGSQPPVETVSTVFATPGTYAARVQRKAKGPQVQVRLQLASGAGQLAQYHSSMTLVDPATCVDAVAVAASPWQFYAIGLADSEGSQGPTFDGRAKPDLAAPSAVQTYAANPFGGSSAASAHVAGALAVWIQHTGQAPSAAMASLLKWTVPRPGSPQPDLLAGRGRLALPTQQAGAACIPGQIVACQVPCGASSTTLCTDNCKPGTCAVPAEVCDGVDQNCNGKTDEGFACSTGMTASCLTTCGTGGVRTCQKTCAWTTCSPPPELCNGVDDDCDGTPDNGFGCAVGLSQACSRDGATGTMTCDNTCGWGVCLPAERCNGKDDDGNGTIDDGLTCPPPKDGGCGARNQTLASGLPWLMLACCGLVLARRRRRPSSRQTFWKICDLRSCAKKCRLVSDT